MTAQFARTPYRGRSGGSTAQEPHAALLIDFDNVTMGIRSDLTKELKNLLNSDIIKGKVAVQRAYADWRRYPQYIVPLAESSVDLIFAPAYGSAKKNATDIRLAIDAVELVFTRPEIGTIILLSGDSDFSSLVLKLKEYGKYVIGVGIRESASDLLVQNCDEYYSYSALTGLTRAGDEGPIVSEDPWELVDLALNRMIENDDVMRSDRLKQVLLELDPTFDEKAQGFQKFNKFLQEAANRGILSLRKQENGQYEVGPPSEVAAETEQEREGRESRDGRGRRGRRGRGRREEREPRRDQLELPEEAAAAGAEEPAAVEETAAEAVEQAAAPEKPRRREAAPAAPAPEQAPAAEAPAPAAAGQTDGMAAGYDLLRQAVTDLVRKNGPAVRDSDVKRRMLELHPGWDEASLGFSKFSRFLRTAHDAEVITLRKAENGVSDVLLGDGGVHVEPEREERGGRGRGRGRGREARESRPRGDERAVQEPAAGAAQVTEPAPQPAAVAAPADAPAAATATPRETQVTPPATERPSVPAAVGGAAIGFRRGSRGRPAPAGPPPLLEGQAAVVPKQEQPRAAAKPPETEGPPPTAAEPAAAPQPPEAARAPEPAGRRRGRKAAKEPASQAPARQQAEKPKPGAAAKPAGKPAAPRVPDAAALGLPVEPQAIVDYMSTNYKGVGPKSVQTLLEAVGPGKLYDALEKQHDRVREVIGTARGERLIDSFADDIAARRANAAPDSRSVVAKQQPAGGRGPRKGRGAPPTGSGARRGPPRGKPRGK
jgi:uncharacterized protein (TIGR00288 family)